MLPRNRDPTEFLYASRKPKQRYREPCRAVVSSMEPETAVARAEPMPAPRNPQSSIRTALTSLAPRT